MYSSSVNDVDNDWEVGEGQDHLEFIADGDSSNHVSDNAFGGTQDSVSLLSLKPHSEFE